MKGDQSNETSRKVRLSSESISKNSENRQRTNDDSLAANLRNMLQDINVGNASWQKTENNSFYNIMFTIETGYRQEKVLQFLTDYNVGVEKDTSVSMMSCSMHTSSFAKFSNENEYDNKG